MRDGHVQVRVFLLQRKECIGQVPLGVAVGKAVLCAASEIHVRGIGLCIVVRNTADGHDAASLCTEEREERARDVIGRGKIDLKDVVVARFADLARNMIRPRVVDNGIGRRGHQLIAKRAHGIHIGEIGRQAADLRIGELGAQARFGRGGLLLVAVDHDQRTPQRQDMACECLSKSARRAKQRNALSRKGGRMLFEPRFRRHGLLTKLLCAAVGGRDRLDAGRAEGRIFKRAHALDRTARRTANGILQLLGVAAGFKHGLSRTEDGLGRIGDGLVARKTAHHAAIGKRLDEHIHKGRATAGYGAGRIHEFFVNTVAKPCVLHSGKEERNILLVCRCIRRIEDHALTHTRRRVRHHADGGIYTSRKRSKRLEIHTRRHADQQKAVGAAFQRVLDAVKNGGKHLRLHAEEDHVTRSRQLAV